MRDRTRTSLPPVLRLRKTFALLPPYYSRNKLFFPLDVRLRFLLRIPSIAVRSGGQPLLQGVFKNDRPAMIVAPLNSYRAGAVNREKYPMVGVVWSGTLTIEHSPQHRP